MYEDSAKSTAIENFHEHAHLHLTEIMADYETRTWLACDVSRVRHVSDTDTRKSVSDTPNEVSNILIFFRTRQRTQQTVNDTFFF